MTTKKNKSVQKVVQTCPLVLKLCEVALPTSFTTSESFSKKYVFLVKLSTILDFRHYPKGYIVVGNCYITVFFKCMSTCRHNATKIHLTRSQRSEGVRRSDFDSIYNSVFCFIFWKIFNDYNMIIQDNEQLWLHVKYHYGSLKSICNTFISFSALRKSSKLRFWQHLQLSFIFYFLKDV